MARRARPVRGTRRAGRGPGRRRGKPLHGRGLLARVQLVEHRRGHGGPRVRHHQGADDELRRRQGRRDDEHHREHHHLPPVPG
ncbi:MAG: hypothetical protein ACK559_02990, partial [bacterium]